MEVMITEVKTLVAHILNDDLPQFIQIIDITHLIEEYAEELSFDAIEQIRSETEDEISDAEAERDKWIEGHKHQKEIVAKLEKEVTSLKASITFLKDQVFTQGGKLDEDMSEL